MENEIPRIQDGNHRLLGFWLETEKAGKMKMANGDVREPPPDAAEMLRIGVPPNVINTLKAMGKLPWKNSK